MKKALVALVLSPFIFAGSTGSSYRVRQDNHSLLIAIQQKADSAAYAAVIRIDSLCRRPIDIILYRDLDKRPDGKVFLWEAWAQVVDHDTLYTHTVIRQL